MLVATVLSLLVAPAAGLMFAGAVRSKNAMMALTHALTVFVVCSLTWFMWGFSISFGPSIGDVGFVGTPEWSFLVRFDVPECYKSAQAIPLSLFLLYQMAFALFAPAVITGVWAEKLTYRSLIVFTLLWPLMVYNFVAHWIWHHFGWLRGNARADFQALDFTGGIVVLTSAGAAAVKENNTNRIYCFFVLLFVIYECLSEKMNHYNKKPVSCLF